MKLELLKKKINKKKIFITGNTGFVGSWLSIMLTFFGAKILGFSLKKKDKKFISNHVQFKKNIKTICINNKISNKTKLLKKYSADFIHISPNSIHYYLDSLSKLFPNLNMQSILFVIKEFILV